MQTQKGSATVIAFIVLLLTLGGTAWYFKNFPLVRIPAGEQSKREICNEAGKYNDERDSFVADYTAKKQEKLSAEEQKNLEQKFQEINKNTEDAIMKCREAGIPVQTIQGEPQEVGGFPRTDKLAQYTDDSNDKGFLITDLASKQTHQVKIDRSSVGFGDTGSVMDRFVLWVVHPPERRNTGDLWVYNLDTKKEQLLLKGFDGSSSDFWTSGRNAVNIISGKLVLVNVDTKESKEFSVSTPEYPSAVRVGAYGGNLVFFVGSNGKQQAIFMYDTVKQTITKLHDVPVGREEVYQMYYSESSREIYWKENEPKGGWVVQKYYKLKI